MVEADRSPSTVGRPVARSPVRPAPPISLRGNWEVSARRSSAQLRLTDLSALAKINVKDTSAGSASERLGAFGQARRWPSGNLVIGEAPGEWMVLGPSGREERLAAEVEAASTDTFTTLTDLTHGYAVMRLTGRAARTVLSKLCAVDLSGRSAPNGNAVRTSLAGIVAGIVRDDLEEELSFLCYCERSSGQYLFDVLLDAGAEFAVDVDGYPEKEI